MFAAAIVRPTLEDMQYAYVAHRDSLERKVLTLIKPE